MSPAKKNKSNFSSLLHHPVQLEKIPHIVAAVTLFYMFGFLFIALGFILSQSSQVKPVEVNPVEVAPSNLQQDYEPYYFEQEYNQEGVLGEQDLQNTQPVSSDSSETYTNIDDQNYDDPYFQQEVNEGDYYYNDESNLDQDYYDEEYYNYWEDDSGNMYYGDTQTIDSTVTDVYLTEPVKDSFMTTFNSKIDSNTLLFIGFSVLAMGILIFIVNHIHEKNHFSHKPHHKISKNK